MTYVADIILLLCLVGFLISFGISFYHVGLRQTHVRSGYLAILFICAFVVAMMFIAPHSHLAAAGL